MGYSESSGSEGVPRGPLRLMNRVYRYILPEVGNQLNSWREAALGIPDPELKKQAIASMTFKRFHCEGGAVYAAANLPQRHILIPLIVALQTISDYLDNLCDRSTSQDETDFRQLHQAMLDAVDPSASLHEYYKFHDERDDGGYLDRLVKTCQSCICMLPSYSLVQEQVREWVQLYCDLQVYKHIRQDLREAKLLQWWDRYQSQYPGLLWNEFAAATGSTLGIFNLFLVSSDKFLTDDIVQRIRTAYFPYLCSLHILLDYLIDMDEDKRGGDLNFCSYYASPEETEVRIGMIADEARKRVGGLDHSRFHRMVIEGLLALYLSDPKVKDQHKVKRVSRRLMRNSPLTRLFFWVNSLWIRRMNHDLTDAEKIVSFERNG